MSRKRLKQKSAKPSKRNGLFIIIGVVALALVAVAVLIFANARPPAPGEFMTVEKKEWPQPNGKALGPADAPVVVREFSDFQCPYCRMFHETVQEQLIADYVATGKVRFEYSHYIVIDGNVGGNESRRAAIASECAADQNMFWDYQNILFANQQGEGTGAFKDVRLEAFAESLGLDVDAFNSCLSSSRLGGNVSKDEAAGRQLGVRGTPAVFVNDQMVENPLDYNALKAVIDAAVASAGE